MNSVRFLSIAEKEMIDAAIYYNKQASGLGSKFLYKIESALNDIKDSPERYPVVRGNIRRRLIHRFPYCLLYRVDPDEIVIVATMN